MLVKEEAKIVLGIAYLRTIIIAIFTFVSYLQLLFYYPIDKYYIKACLLLFGFYAVILFVLFKLKKKHNQGFHAIFNDNTIRKATGILILISCLISLFVYVPAIINSIAQIINDNLDVSIIPSIISAVLIVCQTAVGIYLLKYKNKTDGQYNAGIVIGIAYLNTIITFAFSFVEKLSQSFISHSPLNKYFLLWFVPIAVIMVVLFILNKKQNQNLISIFKDKIVRKSTGVLILISGLINASNVINTVANNILLRIDLYKNNYQTITSITKLIVNFVIILCQILFGIYLLKYYKSKAVEDDIAQ